MTRYWIGTVSLDHVKRGVSGGFAQIGHGKGAPLRRMARGDWMIYYSPKTSLANGEALQAFTAIGQIADEEVYQVEMSEDFQPWRRNVSWANSSEVPIRPLLEQLTFTSGKTSWGYAFRRGHFEISEADFVTIRDAMGVVPLE